MTKTYETKQIVIEEYVPVEITCDRCGAILHVHKHNTSRVFILKYVTGYSMGRCGNEVAQVDDLCDDCAVWLLNLLEQSGVKVRRFNIF